MRRRLYFCPSVRPSVRPSVCLSLCFSVSLSLCLSLCLYVSLSVSLSLCPSAHVSVCLSIGEKEYKASRHDLTLPPQQTVPSIATLAVCRGPSPRIALGGSAVAGARHAILSALPPPHWAAVPPLMGLRLEVRARTIGAEMGTGSGAGTGQRWGKSRGPSSSSSSSSNATTAGRARAEGHRSVALASNNASAAWKLAPVAARARTGATAEAHVHWYQKFASHGGGGAPDFRDTLWEAVECCEALTEEYAKL